MAKLRELRLIEENRPTPAEAQAMLEGSLPMLIRQMIKAGLLEDVGGMYGTVRGVTEHDDIDCTGVGDIDWDEFSEQCGISTEKREVA